MNLASPAPRVEPALAEKAPIVETASTDPPSRSEPTNAEPAPDVEPAVTVDDPNKFAPSNVTNAQPEPPQNLSVAALRKPHGADFESEAAVLRGPPGKNFWKWALPFLSTERNSVVYGEVVRFVLIKNGSCFVFADKTDPSPLFAIPLDEVKPVVEDPHHPDTESVIISPSYSAAATKESMTTVLLKYHDGRQAFQFTFDSSKDKTVVKRFMDVLQCCGKNVGVVAVASASGVEKADVQMMKKN